MNNCLFPTALSCCSCCVKLSSGAKPRQVASCKRMLAMRSHRRTGYAASSLVGKIHRPSTTEAAMTGVDGSCHTPEPMMQTGLFLGREG